MVDKTLVIYRRPTPAGRTTYWIDHPGVGESVRITSALAKKYVDIGKARWAS